MIVDCISEKKYSKSNCIVQFIELVESLPLDVNGCKIWPKGISHTGYGVYSIDNFTYSVPRLIFNVMRNGYYRDGMVVRHKCDNRSCCNIDHLEIGTQSDNIMDASKRGRLRFGEKNNKTFLTEIDIHHIREQYPEKSTVELGKMYKTSPSNIRDIIIGKTWKNVPGSKKLIKLNRAIGEKSSTSKLSEKEVLEIRNKYPKKTGTELAKEYGVSHRSIYCVLKRISWKHI